LGPAVKTYIQTTYDLPQNRMKHVESIVPAAQNVIKGTSRIDRVGMGKYEGGRLIVGDGEPVNQAGLPGDEYQSATGARWRVKTPSYTGAEWEAVE
jgi:hypothetical protein